MSECHIFVDESSNHDKLDYLSGSEAGEVMCLICGIHVRNDPLVKVEPVEGILPREDEGEGDEYNQNKQVESMNGDGHGGKLKSTQSWSDEEQQLFPWFLKWFSLKLKGLRWNYSLEPFPFCTVCKNQLIFLLDVRRKIDELEGALKNGLGEMKDKVNATEGEFQLSGIYQRDPRYIRVRQQVSENLIWVSSAFKDISALLPFVRLSASDKATAEMHPGTLPYADNVKLEALEATFKSTRRRGRPKSRSKNLHKVTKREYKALIYENDALECKPAVSKLVEVVKRRRGRPKKHLESSSLVGSIHGFSDDGSSDSFKMSGRKEPDEDDDYEPLIDDDLEAHNSDPEDSTNSNLDVDGFIISKGRSKTRPKNIRSDTEAGSELNVPVTDGEKTEQDSLKVAKAPVKIRRKVGRPRKPVVEKDDTEDEESDFEVHKSAVAAHEIGEDRTAHVSSRSTGKGTKKMKIDPQTGIITCLKVQFKPLENDLYTCTKCLETVKRNPAYKTSLFREHVLRVHSKRHVCPKCGYRAVNILVLDSHINRVHKGIKIPHRTKPYVCNYCGKKQPSKKRLHYHRWNIHYTEKDKLEALARGEEEPPPNKKEAKIQCEDCGTLVVRSGMATHKLCKHGTEEEQSKAKVLCNHCGKYVYSFGMSNHMYQSHPEIKGVPAHICGECGKVFKLRSGLRNHLKVHRGLDFKCPICGKGFRTTTSFTGHMNLHNNVRPYQCDHCPLAFATVKMWKKHHKHYHAEGSAPKRPPFLRGLEKRSRMEDTSIPASEINTLESNSNQIVE